MRKSYGIFMCVFLLSFCSVNVLGGYFGPVADLNIVVDNIDEFPEYTLFMSDAAWECRMIQEGVAIVPSACNYRPIEHDPVPTVNTGRRWQCFSMIYAVKTATFDEGRFREMSMCEKAKYLNSTVRLTNLILGPAYPDSDKVEFVEDHYILNLSDVQTKPAYSKDILRTEENSAGMYLIVGSIVLILAILAAVVIFLFKKN